MTSDSRVHARGGGGGGGGKRSKFSRSPKTRIFVLMFSRNLYLGNHLSESIHTRTPGSMLGGGARGQNLVHLQKLGFLC